MAKICKNCGKRLADNIFYCDCGGISFVSGEELKDYNNLRDSIQKLLELIRTVDISSKKDFPLMDFPQGGCDIFTSERNKKTFSE